MSTLPSITLWTRCGEGSSNARLEEPFRRFLKRVTSDRAAHSRFLNTLSLLEHIGSRKIMLSQMRENMDKETLKHMAEETRHAFFFKQQAERFNPQECADYGPSATLCPAAARMYFGRLDAGMRKLLGENAPTRAAYSWMSFIIELRAAWAYPLYEAALKEARASVPLKSVIAEEEKHLAEMETTLRDLGLMNDLLLAHAAALETKLFARLLDALLNETAQPESANSVSVAARRA